MVNRIRCKARRPHRQSHVLRGSPMATRCPPQVQSQSPRVGCTSARQCAQKHPPMEARPWPSAANGQPGDRMMPYGRGRHPPMAARGSCCGARLGRCVVFQRWDDVPVGAGDDAPLTASGVRCNGAPARGSAAVWRRASSWRDGAGDRNVPDGSDGVPRLAADTFDSRDPEVSAGRCGRRRRGDPVWL